MFEGIKEYRKHLETEKEELVTPNLSGSILLHPELFKKKLLDIDNISDKELFEIVENYYEQIFSEEYIAENKNNLKLITNSRLLMTAINIFNTIQVPYNTKLYCNKIYYDYTIMYNQEENKEYEYTSNLLFNLARSVNKDKISSLIGIGLPADVAIELLVCRYSSNKETTNISRLNYSICKQDENLMTEQNIVRIYEKLFDSVSELFQIIMFYPYDETQNETIYCTISLAILDIVNSMPFESIKIVLRSYVAAYESGAYRRELITSNNEVIDTQSTYIRFPIRTCSMDYERILNAVKELEDTENIYVP